MSHRSLYRRYRPQSFDDVVGQAHITRTLRNAVAAGTVAHAYLFTGPRGTGKTTTARILAKALDCVQGPTPDPDNTCQDCTEIAEGRHPDVHELDAASRTGVDAVREEIIGRVNYAPTRGKWKVYIIDEVHMLSTSAFNALLKTLEEPPSHTVFVLATTHPHKVPETIHSRCQRFDFHRIGAEDIVGRLATIAERESIKVAEGALALMAKHAAGGMRDAITTLEQLAAFTGDDISLDDVEGLLGETDSALLLECAQLVSDRDVAECFRFVARLAESGVDIGEFTRDLAAYIRDLYVVAVVGDPAGIVDATSDQVSRLASLAAGFTPDRLARVLELLAETGAEVRRGMDARLALEVALTRMARPQGDLTLSALAQRVEVLEAELAAAGGSGGGEVRRSDSPRRGPAAPSAPSPAAELAADLPATTPASSSGGAASGVAIPADSAADAASPPARGSAGETSSAGGVAETAPAAGGAGEAAVPAPAAAGGTGALDRARARRAWPAAIAEFKKVKPSRSHLFTNTDVDVDGDELVVEFPESDRALLELANDADTLKLLRRSLGVVLGEQPQVRYQVGRGTVKPKTANAPAPSPAPAPAAPVGAPTERVALEDDGQDRDRGGADHDVHAAAERLLVDELGAEVIHEEHDDQE